MYLSIFYLKKKKHSNALFKQRNNTEVKKKKKKTLRVLAHLSTVRSLTWFKSFKTSSMEGTAADEASHTPTLSFLAACLCLITSFTETCLEPAPWGGGGGRGGGGGGRAAMKGVEVRTGAGNREHGVEGLFRRELSAEMKKKMYLHTNQCIQEDLIVLLTIL